MNVLMNPVFVRVSLGGSDSKESACNVGDLGLIPELGRSLKEGMVTHCSILAWRIPWTDEPGGLQSMGLQRVGHDIAIKHSTTQYLLNERIDAISPVKRYYQGLKSLVA